MFQSCLLKIIQKAILLQFLISATSELPDKLIVKQMSHLQTEQSQANCRVEPKKEPSSHIEQYFKSLFKRSPLFGQRSHLQRYSQRLSQVIGHLNEANELINLQDVELISYYLDPNNYPIRESLMINIEDEQIASNCLLGFVSKRKNGSIVKKEHNNRLYLEQVVSRLLKNQIGINQIKNIVQNKEITLFVFQNILKMIVLLKRILLEDIFEKMMNNLQQTLWNKLQTLLKDHVCIQLNNILKLFFEILLRQTDDSEREQLNIHFRLMDELYKQNYIEKAIQYFNHSIYQYYDLKCMSLSNQKIVQNIIDKIISLKKQSIQISMPLELFKIFITKIKIRKEQIIQILTLFNQEQIMNTLLINQSQLPIQGINAIVNILHNQGNIPNFIQTDFLFSVAERLRQIDDTYEINKVILNKYEICIKLELAQSNYFLRKLLNYRIKEKSLQQIIKQLQNILSQFKEMKLFMKDRLNILERIGWIIQQIIPKIHQLKASQRVILNGSLPITILLELLTQFVLRAYSSQLLPKICSILDGLIQIKDSDNDSSIWVFIGHLTEIQFESNFSSLVRFVQVYKHIKCFAIFCYLADNMNAIHEFNEQQLRVLLNVQQIQPSVYSLSCKRKELVYYLICLPVTLSIKKVDIICQFLINIEPINRCELLQQLINILSQTYNYAKDENKVSLLFHNICIILSSIYNQISLTQKNNIRIYQKIIAMQQQFRQFKHSQIDYIFLLKQTETQMHIRNTLNVMIRHHFKEMFQMQQCILEYFADLIIVQHNNADLQQLIKQHFSSLIQQLKSLYFKICYNDNKSLQLKIIKIILLILKTALFSKDIRLIHNSIQQLDFDQLTNFLKDHTEMVINPHQKISLQFISLIKSLALTFQNRQNFAEQQIQLLQLIYFLTVSSQDCQFSQIVIKSMQFGAKTSRIWIFGLRFMTFNKQIVISHLWRYFMSQFANRQLDSKCRPYLECICYCLANEDINDNIMQQVVRYFEVNLFVSDDYSFSIILASLKQKLIQKSANSKSDDWRNVINSLIEGIKSILYLGRQVRYQMPQSKVISNLGIMIQVISLFFSLQPEQQRNHIVPIIKVILSTPTLEYKLTINKIHGIKHISIFHFNSFVNIALQFLASSKYFMRIFMAIQFDISVSPICYMLQKTLVNLNYSCLDTIGCFQLIKTIGCFCREEQDCLSFTKWLIFYKISQQLDSQRRQAILRLFKFQYSRGEVCRCSSYYQQTQKTYFQVHTDFIHHHQYSNHHKLNLCLRCFVFKTQAFCYKELPKYFFLRQSNTKQIKQAIRFKVTQNNLNGSYCKYSLCLLMLFHKGQYCFAKKLKGIWYIILPSKNIISYNNLQDMLESLHFQAIQLYCSIYEQQQTTEKEINFSKSCLGHIQEVNSFNRRIILKNIENQNNYKENFASSFLNTVRIIKFDNLDFFELVDLYSQRYQISQNFNQILLQNMDNYIEYLINNYIGEKKNHILKKLRRNHERRQNFQYYKQFYCVIFQKAIEKKRYILNVSIRRIQQESILKKQNIRKQMQLVEELLKEVQNILLISLGKDKEMNENMNSIAILSNIICFTSQQYLKIHLFTFLLNNSTITNLITIYINQQIALNRQGKRNLFYIISQCINFLIEQRNLSQDDNQLSPNDHRSLFWSNFIESVVLKFNGKSSIQLLSSILRFSALMDEHKLRMKIVFRIIGLFYYKISIHNQNNEVQSELLQFLINNLNIQELSYLLGYKIGDVYLNCFRLFDFEEIQVGLISIISGNSQNRNSQYFYYLLRLLHNHSDRQKLINYIQQLCCSIIKTTHIPADQIDVDKIQETQQCNVNRSISKLVNQIVASLDINPTQIILNQQNLEKRILISQKEVDKLHLADAQLKITFRVVEICIEKTFHKIIRKQKERNLIIDIICEKETSYEYLLELKEKSKSQWKGPKLIYLKSTSNKNLFLQQKKTIILTQQSSKKKSKFSKFDVLIH